MSDQPTTAAGRHYVQRLRDDERAFHHHGPQEAIVTDYVAEALDAVLDIEREAAAGTPAGLGLELRETARAFLNAAALESMTKAPEYIAAKRALRKALAQQPETGEPR
mgnify:CR=1 FL=1